MIGPDDRFDVFIATCGRDIRYLRHFLLSYATFFTRPGKIHVLIRRDEQYLLDDIWRPDNLVVHYKDDVPELVADDFRNQMYLKLIADRFVETEWFWVPDADYLITAPLSASDFCADGKPNWYCCEWRPFAESHWRKATEAFLGEPAPIQFMRNAQYLLNRTILRDMQNAIDCTRILTQAEPASEFNAYGAFAHPRHHDRYAWIDFDRSPETALGRLVNQRPDGSPVLDPSIALADFSDARYCVFWSWWDLADRKMGQFLAEASQQHGRPLPAPVDTDPLYPELRFDAAGLADPQSIGAIYPDAWMHGRTTFMLRPAGTGAVALNLEVHGPASLACTVGPRSDVIQLQPGLQTIEIAVDGAPVAVDLRLEGGISEPGTFRRLYARWLRAAFSPAA